MRRSRFNRSSRSSSSAAAPSSFPETRRVGRSRVPFHRRLLTARSALGYWVAVLVLALGTGTVVSRLVGRAVAAEHRFGPTRVALVTTQPMRAGQRVTARVTRLEVRPTAQLGAGALHGVPTNASVSGPVAAGEVLTEARLVTTSASGTGSTTAAMAVPLGDAPLAVRPGDRVDVYATYDPALVRPGAAPTSRVAARGEVVRAGRTSVTVAVRAAEVPGLATALARATVTMALVR